MTLKWVIVYVGVGRGGGCLSRTPLSSFSLPIYYIDWLSDIPVKKTESPKLRSYQFGFREE